MQMATGRQQDSVPCRIWTNISRHTRLKNWAISPYQFSGKICICIVMFRWLCSVADCSKCLWIKKKEAHPVNAGVYIDFKHCFSFATDLATNLGCNKFRIMLRYCFPAFSHHYQKWLCTGSAGALGHLGHWAPKSSSPCRGVGSCKI